MRFVRGANDDIGPNLFAQSYIWQVVAFPGNFRAFVLLESSRNKVRQPFEAGARV